MSAIMMSVPECGEIVIFHAAGYNNVGTVGDSISNKRGFTSAAHGHFSHHELRGIVLNSAGISP